jgi:hypothetical protein
MIAVDISEMARETIIFHRPMRLKSSMATDAERAWQTGDEIVIFQSVLLIEFC